MTAQVSSGEMESETERVRSYPSSVPEEVALNFGVAGFYYISGSFPVLSVQCFVCALHFECNSAKSNPLAEHVKRNNQCGYLRSVASIGVTAPAASDDHSGAPERSEEVDIDGFDVDENTVDLTADLETRLMTYDSERWPKDCPVEKEDLAAAGFYFTGRADQVRCYACMSVFHRWAPGDNPLDEHQRMVPDCKFLRSLVTGDKFTLADKSGELLADPHEHSPFMHSERHRLATYADYPEEATVTMPPSALARSGCYYTGNGDTVRCAFCRVVLRDFQPGNFAHRMHRAESPFCTLVRGSCTMNVPLDSSLVKVGMEDERARFESFANWPKQLGVSVGELATAGLYYSGTGDHVVCYSCLNLFSDWSAGQLGVDRHKATVPSCLHVNGANRKNIPALMPQVKCTVIYGEEKARRQSFANWPSYVGVDGDDLAEAGFFFTGEFDIVQCAFCSVQARHWRRSHSPHSRHEGLSPSCEFIRKHSQARASSPVAVQAPIAGAAAVRISVTPEPRQASRLLDTPTFTASSSFSSLDVGVVGDERLLLDASSCPNFSDPSSRPYATQPAPFSPRDISNVNSDGRARLQLNRSLSCREPVPRTEKDIELERIKSARSCVICLDREASQFFNPCAHLVCCEPCSHLLTKCPMCLRTIGSSTRVFFP
eukprot:scpid37287/ scgid24163/ E3 ubiquitin-protein ligase XIAP; Baculoviral IAP repeat-containing protein 4; IAP-like protein; Inhibitor of apoptosis protein 3; X-linked inhibitor of apoptosis protein